MTVTYLCRYCRIKDTMLHKLLLPVRNVPYSLHPRAHNREMQLMTTRCQSQMPPWGRISFIACCIWTRSWSFNAAFTWSNYWADQSADRSAQPVGRIKHVKFIQPVGPTVASSKRSSNCRADSRTMQTRSPNQPIKWTYNHDALNDVIFLSALNIG